MEPLTEFPQTLLGTSVSGQVPYQKYPYMMQWNANIERSFGPSTSMLLSYIGSRGLHLGSDDVNLNQLPDQCDSLRDQLLTQAADVRQRAVISYILDLPFGKGKRYLSSAQGVTDKVVSGWNLSGITTFQTGLPIGLTVAALQSSTVNYTPYLQTYFGAGTPRPNVVPGVSKLVSGSPKNRINEWFNTAAFTSPDPYGFGNESRLDSQLRSQGIDNFDIGVIPAPSTISPEAQRSLARQDPFPMPDSLTGRRLKTDEWESREGMEARSLYPANLAESSIAGVPVRIISPITTPEPNRERVLINVHGGGFMVDSGSLTESIPSQTSLKRG